MRKFCLVLTAVMLITMLCGCNILESDNPPTLPQLSLDASTLTGTVEFVNGRTCRVVVSQGDSHFDGPYVNRNGEDVPGDTIHVTFTTLSGAKALAVGDTVSFRYSYTRDVSEKNGDPHISIHEIKISK